MDNLSASDRQKAMRAVKSKNTSLERKLWAMLAGMHIKGWKKNLNTVIGSPDAVFIEEKIAIFIDGCFWHGCPICNKPLPVHNADYWKRKINRNIERAKEVDLLLEANGWKVVRIWEHDFKLENSRKKIQIIIRYYLDAKFAESNNI